MMIEPLQWKKNFINSPKMISELLFSNLKSLETKKLVNPTSKENTIGTHKREQHQKYHLIRIKARREYFDVIHGKATSEALFRQRPSSFDTQNNNEENKSEIRVFQSTIRRNKRLPSNLQPMDVRSSKFTYKTERGIRRRKNEQKRENENEVKLRKLGTVKYMFVGRNDVVIVGALTGRVVAEVDLGVVIFDGVV